MVEGVYSEAIEALSVSFNNSGPLYLKSCVNR